MSRSLPELLAPAGDPEALVAVIEAGADAVYVAGKRFGMRQHARWLNFEASDLQAAIRYAHEKGRRIYVAVNNLLTDAELEQVETFVRLLVHWGPDAIIIQDLGLLQRLHRCDLPFELHASCMMNVHNLASARRLAALGVSRIIASRDITLAFAAGLQRMSGLAFEYFLHGDMCIAQSGQCTTSGILAGESASRGRCLKPCRWRWELVDERNEPVPDGGGFLLARKDLCLLEQVPAIVESGIAGVKIEGRARTPAHLARIVRAYRSAFDAYASDPPGYALDGRLYEDLTRHRIRDFSTCMTFGEPGREGIGRDGSSEPRIFSVVIEQPPLDDAARIVPPPGYRCPRPELVVHCGEAAAVQAALNAGAQGICLGGECWRQHEKPLTSRDIRHIWEQTTSHGAKLYWMAPRISEQAHLADPPIAQRHSSSFPFPPALFDACYVHSLGQLETARSLDIPAVADIGLNLFNAAAFELMQGLGASRGVASLELGLSQLEEIAASTTTAMELLIHGPVVGMISEHCVIAAACGCERDERPHGQPPCTTGIESLRSLRRELWHRGLAGVPNLWHRRLAGGATGGAPVPHLVCGRRPRCVQGLSLRDEAGQLHPVLTDSCCRNHILLPRHLCALPILGKLLSLGPACLRIDGRHERPDSLGRIVTVYASALDRLCRGEEVPTGAMRRLIDLHPQGLSLGAYGLAVPDVSLPGKTLPTNEWIRPEAAPELVEITVGRTAPTVV